MISNNLPFGECLGLVAPYYNLTLVLVVLVLFLKLFSIHNKKVFLLPWKLLFFAVAVYIVEELLTVFIFAGIIVVPRIINAVFEFIIITIFIYFLLIQREYLEKNNRDKINKRKNA
ncbi:MAG: hypothetical protein KAK00_01440 [Nanoarchaeota archaeon]|nr:hypothetical protein [Nanoarchaeota archaeon]